jgi:hypothetical protein
MNGTKLIMPTAMTILVTRRNTTERQQLHLQDDATVLDSTQEPPVV